VKIGDLVKNLNSESRMMGIIVGWTAWHGGHAPIVLWSDGRCNWIVPHRVETVQ